VLGPGLPRRVRELRRQLRLHGPISGPPRHPALVLSAGQLIAATIELAIVLPFAGLQAVHWRWDAIAALAVLGALGTGIAYVLNYRLITDEGTTASVVTYLLPIVAVILGAAILGDHITAQIISGMLIVILGVAVTRRTREPSTR
jgi:drug/metabolite transporter (DMT)-like permease